MTKLAYTAQDRSLLLPYYKRLLVEPLVRRLPASLSPNAITHAGHLINLAALTLLLVTGARSGWPLVVAGLLVQLYVICDNADGTHARRTGQSSAYGELLDHGLDTLNVAYIACMSAYALGLSPMGWVVLVTLVTGASAFTFFEQKQTGLFVLGRLNQQESSLVLTTTLFVGATLGTSWFADTILVAGISAQMLVLALGCGSLITAMVRATHRVSKQSGARALLPALTLAGFNVAVIALATSRVVSPRVALALAIASNTFFACRMLARRVCHDSGPKRLAGPAPAIERTLLAASVALGVGVLLSFAQLGAFSPHVDTAVGTFATVLFGIAMARDARRGFAQCLLTEA